MGPRADSTHNQKHANRVLGKLTAGAPAWGHEHSGAAGSPPRLYWGHWAGEVPEQTRPLLLLRAAARPRH
eukprot:11215168-Lingulodinium_polyedra.AAC.1